MSKITKNQLSNAKKKAEKTAAVLKEDLDLKLFEFYESYSENNYEKILEKAMSAANTQSSH